MTTILIVDDRPVNRQFLVTLLGYGDHRLLEASDGAEALELARSERPNLIITDILMPTMDGYEFVRRLRDDPAIAATPVVFYTATYRAHEARAMADACGVSHIITKPSDPETILQTVSQLLGVPLSPGAAMQFEEAEPASLSQVSAQLYDYVLNLEMVSVRLAALVEMGLELASQRDPLRLLSDFCYGARDIIGARWAAIGVLDDDGQTLRHFFTGGLNAAAATSLGALSPHQGVLSTLLAERRPIRVGRSHGDAVSLDLPPQLPPIDSFVGVPLLSPLRAYGWLILADKIRGDEFSEEDVRLTATLAAQATVAYENAHLYDEIQRHSVQLAQEVEERKQVEAALRVKDEEARAMSQQLWQAAKLATMGELAANIAHELNNPLATIILRVESLLEETAEDDANRRILEIVEQEAERMGTLIAHLLQFSRRSQPQISTVDIREEVEKTLELVHFYLRNRNIQVVREFAPDAPPPQADLQQLRQLFLNLFTNATDAMPQGGTLTIRVRRDGKQVVTEVSDSGVGIAPEVLSKVTEPFFTTKPEGKGTGLGLAICRRVVQEHRGTFEITSEAGQGTTVRIALPVASGSWSLE